MVFSVFNLCLPFTTSFFLFLLFSCISVSFLALTPCHISTILSPAYMFKQQNQVKQYQTLPIGQSLEFFILSVKPAIHRDCITDAILTFQLSDTPRKKFKTYFTVVQISLLFYILSRYCSSHLLLISFTLSALSTISITTHSHSWIPQLSISTEGYNNQSLGNVSKHNLTNKIPYFLLLFFFFNFYNIKFPY